MQARALCTSIALALALATAGEARASRKGTRTDGTTVGSAAEATGTVVSDAAKVTGKTTANVAKATGSTSKKGAKAVADSPVGERARPPERPRPKAPRQRQAVPRGSGSESRMR